MEDSNKKQQTFLQKINSKNAVGILALLAFGVVVSLGVLVSQRQEILRENVSPLAPESVPSAAEVVSQTCSLVVQPVTKPSPTPSPSPSPTPKTSPSPTPSNGNGEVALKVFNAANLVETFTFNANISPANAGYLPPTFSVTTTTPLANGLAGFANFNTLVPGAVVSYTAQKPPAGYCIVDTGYIVRGGPGGSQFNFTGNACRTVTTVVSQPPNSMTIPMYKFDKCSTDNWAQTNCTTSVDASAAGPSAHAVTITVENSNLLFNRDFSVSVNGSPAYFDNNNVWFKSNRNTTTTYRLLVQNGGGQGVSVDFDTKSGSVKVLSVVVEDLKTGSTVYSKQDVNTTITTSGYKLSN